MKKLLLGPIAAAVYQLVPRLLEMEQIPLVLRIGAKWRSINGRSGWPIRIHHCSSKLLYQGSKNWNTRRGGIISFISTLINATTRSAKFSRDVVLLRTSIRVRDRRSSNWPRTGNLSPFRSWRLVTNVFFFYDFNSWLKKKLVAEELDIASQNPGVSIASITAQKDVTTHFLQTFRPEKSFTVFYWMKKTFDYEGASPLGKYYMSSKSTLTFYFKYTNNNTLPTL